MAFYHRVLIRIDSPNYRKKAIRIRSRINYISCTEAIMKSLKLLNIEDIVMRQCLKCFNKFVHKCFPIFFNHYFFKMLIIVIIPQGNVVLCSTNRYLFLSNKDIPVSVPEKVIEADTSIAETMLNIFV